MRPVNRLLDRVRGRWSVPMPGPEAIGSPKPVRFFCVGAAKTGTTILARLLDQQPDVACLWESYFFNPHDTNCLFHPESNKWRKHGLSEHRVYEWHRAATTKVAVDGELVDQIRTASGFGRIVGEVFEDFGATMEASIVGDKWPWYHNQLETVIEAFPDAKIIYNVRDPRGVWNSGETFRDRKRGQEILEGMLKADENVRRFAQNHDVFTFRYEDLITDTQRVMREIGQFVGFSFEPAALAYVPGEDPLPNRWNWVPTAVGDLDPTLTTKWRREMSPEEQAHVTETCRTYLDRYEYDV